MAWILRLLRCILRCFKGSVIFGTGFFNCIRYCIRHETVDSDVATGTHGSEIIGQSFNGETRGVDVTVLTPFSLITEQLTLHGLNIWGGPTLVGARVYDSLTQVCVAASDITVGGPQPNLTVTIPIVATLAPGKRYRIGFYVQPTSSGDFFIPDSFVDLNHQSPYVENTGAFRINSAHDNAAADAFPVTPNEFVPHMIIRAHGA